MVGTVAASNYAMDTDAHRIVSEILRDRIPKEDRVRPALVLNETVLENASSFAGYGRYGGRGIRTHLRSLVRVQWMEGLRPGGQLRSAYAAARMLDSDGTITYILRSQKLGRLLDRRVTHPLTADLGPRIHCVKKKWRCARKCHCGRKSTAG